MANDYRNSSIVGLDRGIRNNNPGNIAVKDNWQGMVGNDGTFIIFADMSWGVRAIGKSLINMIGEGYDTIATLIPQWSATDQAAYVANVAASTSIDPGTQLGTDPDTIQSLIQAIINQENGDQAQYVTADDMAAGMALINSNFVSTVVQSVTAQAVNDPTTAIMYGVGAVAGFLILRYIFKKK
jgi:hypothetical protein